MLIGDLSEIRSRSVLANPLSASLAEVQDSFLPNSEALAPCARILQRAGTPGRKPGGILLCGAPGTGKTHIIRYAEVLLAAPGDPGWEAVMPFLGAEQLTPAPVRTLVVPVPADPDVDFAHAVCLQLVTQAGDLPLLPRMSLEQYGAVVADAAPRLSARSIGVIVLENLPQRLNQTREPAVAQAEVEFCAAIVRVLSEHGILVVVPASQSRPEGLENAPWTRLAACCEVVPVSRRNLARCISALTAKTSVQREQIREILGQLDRHAPLLALKMEDWVELYPCHASLLDALFIARKFRPDFAPLEFVVEALEGSRGWPADRLITLDVLFHHLLPQLRADDQLRDVMQAYEHCERDVLTQASPDILAEATRLLKAVAFGTACGNRGRSIKWLTHQVLPRDERGFGSAYAVTSAVMSEMERHCRGNLQVRGGGLDRTYALAQVSGGASRRDSARSRFPLMLFDWIHSGIPHWNPEISPKYLRHSQTLTVPPPDGPSECRGIVHFQSASEPLWSDEDVSALKESGAAWALLILSPFQRPEEVETRVGQLTESWDRVVVWRPDLPCLAEARALRKLAPAYTIPTRGGASWRRTKAKARRLLRALYVQRGLLLTSADHWSPSAELENDSLASLLSRALLSVSGTAGTPLTHRREGAPAASERVLAWAALLSDASVRPESEVWGERHLLSWWATRLEVDCSPLVSRLHNLPEVFATVRMGQEIRFFESSLGLIRSAMQRLRNRELSLTDAIGQVAAHFGDDESRLLKWRKSLDNFTGLVRWLPAYEYAHDYVTNAFDTGQPDIDDRRAELLQTLRQPQRLLEAAHRDAFDTGFLQFKKRYIESYSSLHEEAIGRIQTRLDPAAIRSLELLSHLEHADTTSFQKIQLIAKWARSNQCDLPVREILDRYPRCYCNFNPSVRQHVTDPVSRINSLLQAGTEYFRTVLRNTRNVVIDELALQQVGDEVGRQVASLLGRGPLVPIGSETLEALNRIIQKHSDQFRSEFYSQRPKARSAKADIS